MSKEYRNSSEASTTSPAKPHRASRAVPHGLRPDKVAKTIETAVSLRLTPDDYVTLHEIANTEDRSVSSLVRLWIRRSCAAHRASKPPSATPS